ncbi:hypothetical protein CYLTODRAFT_442633 [Cylindrobasidium torrendii FP15055 ss-10]|uniref:C3H1-type domain-containing protein n=1 Tax=Cylindrobasidium torrendii FP15055 ss-10 TaxID=1314674 RepID=A0A0D7BH31_9AGAR|nr:hypothetical protein CYLTODRAFT_442633 [Cylindrobasidium torrendii FP15055 ss-10]
MPFGLLLNTDRAKALENAIAAELYKQGYNPDNDSTMAEYITIMVINNKTPDQIFEEIAELVSTPFDRKVVDWIFEEAAKGDDTAKVEAVPAPAKPDSRRPSSSAPRSGGAGGGIYQQAVSQAGQKRPASARSPSPGNPSKQRRTDPPTGPRALREGATPGNPRSLLERVGPAPRNNNHEMHQQQHIPNGMDTGGMNMMGFPPHGMDLQSMQMQELLVNQLALMQGMAAGMFGMANAGGMNMDMMNAQQMQQGQGMNNMGNGRGGRGGKGGRGGAGGGRGRGGHVNNQASAAPPVVAPVPVPAAAPPPAYAFPERPQSPTLCKFSTKCTNPHCRFAHPSPVATPESGMVLSTEPCEKGRECKDKDCPKTHVSSSVLTAPPQPPPAAAPVPPAHYTPPAHQGGVVPCRFGAKCTRPGCTFGHPGGPKGGAGKGGQPCRFGAACTKATCTFQHPEGRAVLPGTFHRGLGTEPNGASPHKSVKFGVAAGGTTDDLKERLLKLEQDKKNAENALDKKKAEVAA